MTTWPDGFRWCLCITIDFVGEEELIAADRSIRSNRKAMSAAAYGAQRGVDRLLATLAAHNTSATWFLPTSQLDRHPDQCQRVVANGHEVGCCGVGPEDFDELVLEEQVRVFVDSADRIAREFGTRPQGVRVLRGSMAPPLAAALSGAGFAWSSSLLGDDLPYVHPGGAGLVEVPVHYELDDSVYFSFNLDPPLPPSSPRLTPPDIVLQNWIWEAQGYRDEGLCMVLVLHPECVATPGRISLLDDFLTWVDTSCDCWRATLGQVASHHRLMSDRNADSHPIDVFHATRPV